MKELLFGWITKGQYEISFLDSIIAYIEIFGIIFLISVIVFEIKEFIQKFRERKNKNAKN